MVRGGGGVWRGEGVVVEIWALLLASGTILSVSETIKLSYSHCLRTLGRSITILVTIDYEKVHSSHAETKS